jgi:hypothetical protein
VTGEVDMTDFAIGMFLVFFLPVVCYFLSGIIASGGAQTSIREREKPEVNPEPDVEEVNARMKAGEELLRNARTLLAQAESIQEGYTREKFREWAKRALDTTDRYCTKLAETLQGYPEIASRAAPYIERLAAQRKEVQVERVRVKKLDTLNRDG